MKKNVLKYIAIAAGVVVFFLVLSYGFVPQVLQGKIVNQSDISGFVGMSHEMTEWNKAHPEDPAYWSDSMFGGMPTTAISAQTKGDWTQPVYKLLMLGKRPATYLFVTLLGAFLLLLAFGVSWPLAVGGAIAVAFCSYNFQIIQVGHNTKMQAIAFMPWVLAALVWAYRSAFDGKKARALLASALFGLAVSLEVKANHQQITYYLAIMILVYALVLFIDSLVKHKDRMRAFWTASVLLLVLGLAGAATNTNKLLPLAKYTPNTMRGGSELNEGNSKGLDLDYATAWSYGWEELPNLMIANWNGGGSSQAVNPDKSETVKLLRKAGQPGARDMAKALPMYWGPQPFTAGPMYMGAITVFLFVLGLCLYRHKEKWWLLAATVLAVFMALGNHFMAFTKLCFNVLPLYNKFRSVSMALVVLQVSMPLLGILTLDHIIKEGVDLKRFNRSFAIAFAVTGGVCLLAWIFPGIAGDFVSATDSSYPSQLVDAFAADRRMLLRNDAWLSFLFIMGSCALLRWAIPFKGKKAEVKIAGMSRMEIASIGICILLAVNMFAVGKRYLNSDHFTTPKDFNKPFAERPVDKMILVDESPSYRVLDLTVNVFNSSVPSYRHKNVGGYSPAKLQRYQDLIDKYLSKEINALYSLLGNAGSIEEAGAQMAASSPVLNALNTKYVVLDNDYPPLENPGAFGPAWFVRGVTPAEGPAQEIDLLGSVDLRRSAIIGADFSEGMRRDMATLPDGVGEEDSIDMISYTPNELRYQYNASVNHLAVFSEIYYPNGWTAWLEDGTPVQLMRCDWTLRAAMLPAGEHTLVMRFAPESYRIGAAVSRACSIALLLIVLASIVGMFLPGKAR